MLRPCPSIVLRTLAVPLILVARLIHVDQRTLVVSLIRVALPILAVPSIRVERWTRAARLILVECLIRADLSIPAIPLTTCMGCLWATRCASIRA